MSIGPNSAAGVGNLPGFLAAACADLTPYLSGDAVKDFPNLANLPAYVWHGPGGVYNGKIYGVPNARAINGNQLNVHQEVLDAAGLGPIRSVDDLKRAFQAVTRPNDGVFALGDHNSFAYSRYLAAQWFGAPNNWSVIDGKLVKDFETDEFKAGLGLLRETSGRPATVPPRRADVHQYNRLAGVHQRQIIFHAYPA